MNIIKNGDGTYTINEEDFEKIFLNINNNIELKRELLAIIEQKVNIFTISDNYYLCKSYDYDKYLEWTVEDINKIKELFKDTERIVELPDDLEPLDGTEDIMYGTEPIGKKGGFLYCKPQKEPWLIERTLHSDGTYLTISEDGSYNRPWKEEEIKKIQELFNK